MGGGVLIQKRDVCITIVHFLSSVRHLKKLKIWSFSKPTSKFQKSQFE